MELALPDNTGIPWSTVAEAILGLGLAAIAASISLYLIRLLVRSVNLPVGSLWERYLFSRAIAQAQRGDAMLSQQRYRQGVDALSSAFYLRVVGDSQLASSIANHHSGILSRVLVLLEERHQSVRLLSLAKVDKLLNERTRLQRSYLALKAGAKRQRMRECAGELDGNATELRRAIAALADELCVELERPHQYH